MQSLKTITVNAVTLPQVTYKGQPVLTARAIAEVLGADVQQIKDNFKYNRKKFTEGVDYFKLTFAEAKTMGLPTTGTPTLEGGNSYLRFFRCSPMGSVLFTRRGLAKLSKSVGTPQAWAMMDTFIDAYFTLEGLATGSLTVQEGTAKAQEVVKRGQGLFAGIALQDTPSLPDGDHLRTAMALPVNRMATAGRTFDYILVLLLTLHFFSFGWVLPTLVLQSLLICEQLSLQLNPEGIFFVCMRVI